MTAEPTSLHRARVSGRSAMERWFGLVVGSGLALGLALLLPTSSIGQVSLGAGLGLIALVALSATVALGRTIGFVAERTLRLHAASSRDAPTIITDLKGERSRANPALKQRYPWLGTDPPTLERLLSEHVVHPSAIIDSLISGLGAGQSASRVLSTREGTLVVEVERAGGRTLRWTFVEKVVDTTQSDISLPVLMVGRSGEILTRNDAAERLFGRVVRLSDVLSDEPLRHGAAHRIHTSSGLADAILLEHPTDNGREITFVPQVARSWQSGFDTLLSEPGLLDALPVPMMKLSPDGTVLQANADSRAIFGLEPGEDLPPLYELVEGMGRPISDWLNDAARGRGLLKPEIVRAVVPGKEVFLQISLGRAREGDEVVLVGLLNDATELKTLEAQFVQSQKMQAIGQLAGGVAHDFNNLLTAISGHCDLLLLRHDNTDPDYADLTQIAQNANRAASLVNQLLAFSRKQNLQPQALDIGDTVSELVHLLNRLIGERVSLEIEQAPALPTIRADRRQLEQVIVNLVVNARDAMPDGGKIQLTARPEHLAQPFTRDRATVPAGEYAVISIADEGSGIRPEIQSKIFEPFFTTKTPGKGTGLGLSTVYGIVKQTGGFIFVDSECGKGTTFTLYLPAMPDDAARRDDEEAVSEEETARRGGEGAILLVEDEAPVRAFAARALRLRGYQVVEAETAEEALELLEDSELNVDVFVTDVVMPGLDGPTWVRQALRSRPETRVIFISGYAEEGRAEKQARIPNSTFLPKPFSLEKLTDIVAEQFA